MDLNARVNVNVARVNVNFQTVTVTLLFYNFFFIFIPINIKVPIEFHTKFQPNILSRSGETDDLNSFAIFSNGGYLEFSTRLNFTILKT